MPKRLILAIEWSYARDLINPMVLKVMMHSLNTLQTSSATAKKIIAMDASKIPWEGVAFAISLLAIGIAVLYWALPSLFDSASEKPLDFTLALTAVTLPMLLFIFVAISKTVDRRVRHRQFINAKLSQEMAEWILRKDNHHVRELNEFSKPPAECYDQNENDENLLLGYLREIDFEKSLSDYVERYRSGKFKT